jgi:Tfp pilus assembly protein PilN
MIQFNLLPDVKLQYIKTQRSKHLVTFIATIVGIVSVSLLLFSMFVVYIVQGQLITNLDKDISKANTKLESVKDIDKILTVQNQLSTLTSLHEAKPATSRLFSYLQQTTPERVGLTQVQLDFLGLTVTLGGNASSLDDIKIYTDTLKAATYTTDDSTSSQKAFSDVVLSSFSRNDKGASFTITAKFTNDLFDITKTVQMKANTSALTDSVFGEGQ